jgi:tetratricopeptide (TPR) repeat protein
MIRQTFLLTTLASSLVLAQAAPAAARQTAAQAAEAAYQAAVAAQVQKPQIVIPPVQLNEKAIEELARSQAAFALDRARLTGMLATEFELKANLAAELAGQIGQGVGRGTGVGSGQFIVDRERGYYDRGTSALDSGKWQAAIDAFDQAIKAGGTRTDGALYWKAYAQNRLGQRSEALATLEELVKKVPNSRWAGEAKALQVEVRQLVGQPVRPEQESDEELKLLAIRGLLNTDAERAVPLLEPLLQGSASPKLKDQAMFVLGMSDSPKAREILVGVARGKGNPDMQLRAIKYLGFKNAEQNRPLLVEIYKSTTDVDIKRRVIDALMGSSVGGNSFWVYGQGRNISVTSGQNKTNPLVVAAQNDLWNLYQAESEVQLKKQMVQALALAQSEKVLELARTEKNLELRKTAIQNLGMMNSTKTGETLVSLYKDEKDPALKKAIIQGLYLQRNAAALVQIARQEMDSAVKKDAVEKLSTMKNKEATDYMLELLKK